MAAAAVLAQSAGWGQTPNPPETELTGTYAPWKYCVYNLGLCEDRDPPVKEILYIIDYEYVWGTTYGELKRRQQGGLWYVELCGRAMTGEATLTALTLYTNSTNGDQPGQGTGALLDRWVFNKHKMETKLSGGHAPKKTCSDGQKRTASPTH